MPSQAEKSLYLLRGLPGAGKSTLAKSLAREGDLIIAADDFMVDEKGEWKFDWRRLDENHARCREEVERAMKERVSRIFVHNTMRTEAECVPYQELASRYGYRVFSLIIENRHKGKSVHATPDKTVEKMRKSFDISL